MTDVTITVDPTTAEVDEAVVADLDADVTTDELVEEVSIDGMCGVY